MLESAHKWVQIDNEIVLLWGNMRLCVGLLRAKKDVIQEEIENTELSTLKFWEKLNYVLPTKDKGSSIR